jgi:hypothetical protein
MDELVVVMIECGGGVRVRELKGIETIFIEDETF